MNDDDIVGVVSDTVELWRCGSSYYPQIAASYATSAAELGSAADLSDSAFDRNVVNRRGEFTMSGPVPYYLGQLRDELHRVLGESVDNLLATGDALEKVAWAYETTDGNNATGLRETVEDDLRRNENDTDNGEHPPIWTDDERQTQIKDKMDLPPEDGNG